MILRSFTLVLQRHRQVIIDQGNINRRRPSQTNRILRTVALSELQTMTNLYEYPANDLGARARQINLMQRMQAIDLCKSWLDKNR